MTHLLQRVQRRRRERGFTLVELMIAMLAGLIISAAAFLMARSATSFFQHEAGITTAQYGAMLGFSRLQADLRRASFMATPNVQADTRLCGPFGALPVGLQQLAGITMEQEASYTRAGAPAQAVWDLNGLRPDGIIVSGAFDTTEKFSVRLLEPTGGSYNVVLDNDDGAMVRTRDAIGTGGATFATIFRPGRTLRVVDNEGRFALGVISNVTGGVVAGDDVVISLAAAPALATRATQGNCGCEGWCTGAVVNPIARMRYDLRNVDPGTYPQYAGLYAAAAHGAQAFHRGPLEPDRTELVRVELDEAGAEIPATLEVLAEYAVDLQFGIVREIPQSPPLGYPELERLAMGDPQVAAIGGALPGGQPELVRAVSVRFSTRAPKRDRDEQIDAAIFPNLIRFNLGADRGFARMRTLFADVQLPNQARDILLP